MPIFPRGKPVRYMAAASALFCVVSYAQQSYAQQTHPQQPPAAGSLPQASPASLHDTLLAKATTLYYSTARVGLRNFDCQVHVDWARMMKSARKGAALPDNDPRLALLNTVAITLRADLKGDSSLDWNLPEHPLKPVDESQTAMLNQVHHGVEQTLGGLLKTIWSPLVNGSIAETLGEESANITEDANGYTLRTKDPQESITEVFDRGLVMKRFVVESSTLSNMDLKPVFQATPQGLLPAHMAADIRNPGTPAQGPAQPMDADMEYQVVTGIQIPSRITIVMPDVVEMDFKLDGCAVNPR